MVPHSEPDIAGSAGVVVVAAVDRKGLAAWEEREKNLSRHESRLGGLHDSADPWAAAVAVAVYALGRVQACPRHPPLRYPWPQLHPVVDRQHRSQ